MPLAIAYWPDVILALAALVTAVAGLLAGWAALRRTKAKTMKTAEEDCLERLRAARQEAEEIALALHNERMEKLQ